MTLENMEQALPLLDRLADPNGRLSSENDCEPIGMRRKNSSWWKPVRDRSIELLPMLLPSFIQPGHAKPKRELPPTAYLDALRGWAAVIVYIYHAFGIPDLWFFQLPVIRVIFGGGPGMVAIFYVISGYVLSYRMLKMMRNQEAGRLLDCLASSTFRRYLRLYGSTAVATFIAMFIIRIGWWVPPDVLKKGTFGGQLWNWFVDTIFTSNPFAPVDGWIHEGILFPRYLRQMWTIPVEYRGSIVLYSFCAAVSKLSTKSRMALTWVVILIAYVWRAAYVAEFLFGLFIADLSLSRHPERLGPGRTVRLDEDKEANGYRPSVTLKLGYVLLLILGLILLGQPDDPIGVTGPFPFQYLSELIPSWYGTASYTFWLGIGALLVVFALDSYPILQKPFEWGFSQYLGELSFGIYAMHIIVVGCLYQPVLEPLRQQHLGESAVAHIPGIIITTIVVLWTADYFTRVDRMVVRAGRWLQTKTFIEWES